MGNADCGSLVLSHFPRSIMDDAGASRDEIVLQDQDISQNASTKISQKCSDFFAVEILLLFSGKICIREGLR